MLAFIGLCESYRRLPTMKNTANPRPTMNTWLGTDWSWFTERFGKDGFDRFAEESVRLFAV